MTVKSIMLLLCQNTSNKAEKEKHFCVSCQKYLGETGTLKRLNFHIMQSNYSMFIYFHKFGCFSAAIFKKHALAFEVTILFHT